MKMYISMREFEWKLSANNLLHWNVYLMQILLHLARTHSYLQLNSNLLRYVKCVISFVNEIVCCGFQIVAMNCFMQFQQKEKAKKKNGNRNK